jgi:hypothetical protein
MEPEKPSAMTSNVMGSRLRLGIVLAFLVLGIAVLFLAVSRRSIAEAETSDVSGQGGEGVYAVNGATLTRRAEGLEVSLKIPRPRPGEYTYPPPETPGGDPLPPVSVGEDEVFTLWLFVFNQPGRCIDPYVCRLVDILGDETTPEPAAKGAIYQLDAIVATGDIIEMNGQVTVGMTPVVGASLENPLCSHVHVGMAPHGEALEGNDLETQLTSTIGGPEFFWPAEFEFLDPAKGC